MEYFIVKDGGTRIQKVTMFCEMNTGFFSKTYFDEIVQRVNDSVDKINDREDASVHGREIPDDESLLIGNGRRLELAVLFLDICGFTQWDSATYEDQESILTVFNIFMTEMFKIAHDYSGQVEKNTGDGLMAYFVGESPNKRQSACEQAVSAALSMFFVMDHLINPLLSRSNLQTINFRIGIDFGKVTIARIGAARLFNSNVAIGISANIASKMLRDAGKNEIIMGNDVFRSLSPSKQAHCKIFKQQTGFVYTFENSPSQPYEYYKMDGRWAVPS